MTGATHRHREHAHPTSDLGTVLCPTPYPDVVRSCGGAAGTLLCHSSATGMEQSAGHAGTLKQGGDRVGATIAGRARIPVPP